jgi:hypothetical protein
MGLSFSNYAVNHADNRPKIMTIDKEKLKRSYSLSATFYEFGDRIQRLAIGDFSSKALGSFTNF